jgi:hypothetical protein
MKTLHDLISKKQWLILFNVGSVVALLLTGRLRWSRESVLTNIVALLVINGMAAFATRGLQRFFSSSVAWPLLGLIIHRGQNVLGHEFFLNLVQHWIGVIARVESDHEVQIGDAHH